MNQKTIPPPPQYWFCVLLDSVRRGDFQIAHHADMRLRESGIEVSIRGMIPGDEPLEKEVRTDAN